MRGVVLEVNGLTGDGLISGDDGMRYAFTAAAARQAVRSGDRVDFIGADGTATDIFPLAAAPAPPPPAYRGPGAAPTGLGAWGYFKRSVTTKYANGEGRATRAEYWSYVLFWWIFILPPMFVGFLLDAMLGIGTPDSSGPFGVLGMVVAGVVVVGLWLPGVCVLIRRFHDVGLTGWLILVGVIPYVGGLFTFVVSLLGSEGRTNKHGPVPGTAGRATAEVFS